jgi:outer membrane protein TolC
MFVCARRTVVVGLLVLGPSTAWAQPPAGTPTRTVTLDELIARAVANNRPLKIATLQADKAARDLASGKTRQFASLELQVFEGHLNNFAFTFQPGAFGTNEQTGPVPSQVTKVSNGSNFSSYFSFQASQPLVQQRRIHLGIDQLKAEQSVMDERRRAAEQSVVNNVRNLYYAILATESAVKASDAGVAFARERQRLATEQVNAQTMFMADLAAAKADTAGREQAALTLKNQLATLTQQMGILVGGDLDPGVSFAPIGALPEGSIDLATVTAAALSERPDVREAKLKVTQAQDAVKSKKAEFLPDVSLIARVIGMDNVGILPTQIVAVGVFGTWEPFDWGRKRAEIKANSDVATSASLALEETQAQAKLDIDTKYRQLEEARALVPAAQLARDAAAEKLRLAHTRLEANTVLQGDVLEAEAALAAAERDLQRARTAWLTADADFQRALGKR